MKILVLVLAAAALGGCDWKDDEDESDAEEVPPPDDIPPPLPPPVMHTWDAMITGIAGFDAFEGSAMVDQIGGEPFVAGIEVRGDVAGQARQWHVHSGACATGGEIVGPADEYAPLVIDGGGAATAEARIDAVLDPAAFYHVDVHLSPTDLLTVIACGDLVRR